MFPVVVNILLSGVYVGPVAPPRVVTKLVTCNSNLTRAPLWIDSNLRIGEAARLDTVTLHRCFCFVSVRLAVRVCAPVSCSGSWQ